jgi:uncharacterized protein (TIGR03067 family)
LSVRNHRIAAISILLVGVFLVLALGQSMARDSSEIQAVRDRLQGVWVASLAEEGEHLKLEGKAAEPCQVEFDGDKVVFRELIGGFNARGTYFFERPKAGAKIDFKLDAGWIIGIYEVEGDTLKLCLNAFSLPERLGVPTRPQPKKFQSGNGRHIYVFHKTPKRN